MHGQAVLTGTRVSVSVILDCLAAGMTVEEIIAENPVVTAAGVRAAVAYGAALARCGPWRPGSRLVPAIALASLMRSNGSALRQTRWMVAAGR